MPHHTCSCLTHPLSHLLAQVSAIIDCDAQGIITHPTVSQLDPSGLIFGCSERSMTRRPLRNYLQLPTKHPDTLLQDDKVGGGQLGAN